jgi:hypothetical protein
MPRKGEGILVKRKKLTKKQQEKRDELMDRRKELAANLAEFGRELRSGSGLPSGGILGGTDEYEGGNILNTLLYKPATVVAKEARKIYDRDRKYIKPIERALKGKGVMGGCAGCPTCGGCMCCGSNSKYRTM